MNKAQTEIVGLAFVVLLAVIGLLFFVVLSNNQIGTPDFRERQLATSIITAIINTDTPEGKYVDLLRECVARNRKCDETNTYTEQMLAVLDTYGVEYWYRVEGTNIEAKTPDCGQGVVTKAAATQQIPIYGGAEKANIILSLCG
jgi:hypothetical protein